MTNKTSIIIRSAIQVETEIEIDTPDFVPDNAEGKILTSWDEMLIGGGDVTQSILGSDKLKTVANAIISAGFDIKNKTNSVVEISNVLGLTDPIKL